MFFLISSKVQSQIIVEFTSGKCKWSTFQWKSSYRIYQPVATTFRSSDNTYFLLVYVIDMELFAHIIC